MSEQLHQAAERARLERRRRLVGEVAPYLAPGERVLEATSGKGVAPGGRQSDAAPLRVVVTDRRLILLRKKAFRQFSVQAFSFETSRISLGFTAETGGELDVSDPIDRTRVSVSAIPELDLEPLFLALRDRMDEERLDIWIDPPEPVGAPHAFRDLDDVIEIGEPAEEPIVEVMEPRHVPVTVGASTIEEILVAAGFPPESVEGPVPTAEMGQASSERAGESTPGTSGGSSSGPTPPSQPSEPFVDTPVIIPEAEPEPTVEEAGGAAQAGILRWLLASTGAGAALYLHRTAGGEEHLQVEPRRLDARLAMSLVRRATDSLAGPIAQAEPDDQEILVTRWGEAGDERVLLLSGVADGSPGDVTSFARFVLDRLESPGYERASGEAREGDRPALLDVRVSIDEDDRPVADVRLSWRHQQLSGRGHGHTAILGRHLAVARATADALRPVVRGDLVVEHVLLSYPPMDAELVVATVLVGARRFVGATAAGPGDEEAAAARAVLDALNRNLGEIT